jgi:hypothetical protein
MLNYFNLETDAVHRRHELERAIEAESRAALARPEMPRTGWPHLRQRVWTRIAASVLSRWPRTIWWHRGAPMNTNQRRCNQWNAAAR